MSIVGLASKTGPIIIGLVITLDFAKVIIATVLYKNWQNLNLALRSIFLPVCFILVLVTSSGAYAFILKEFGNITNDSEKEKIVLQLNLDEKEKLEARKRSLEEQVAQLPANYVRQRANLMNTFKPEMDEITARLEKINNEIKEAKTARFDSSNDSTNSTIGSLAKVYDIPPDQINRVLAFFITLMIDPLAIALLTLANFLSSLRKKKIEEAKINIYVAKTRAEKIQELIFGKNIPIVYPEVKVSLKDVIGQNIPVEYLQIHHFIKTCSLEDNNIHNMGKISIEARNIISETNEPKYKSSMAELPIISFIDSCKLKDKEDSLFEEPLISPYHLESFKLFSKQEKNLTSKNYNQEHKEEPDISENENEVSVVNNEENISETLNKSFDLTSINDIGFSLDDLKDQSLGFEEKELSADKNYHGIHHLEHLWIDDPIVRKEYEKEYSGFYKKNST